MLNTMQYYLYWKHIKMSLKIVSQRKKSKTEVYKKTKEK